VLSTPGHPDFRTRPWDRAPRKPPLGCHSCTGGLVDRVSPPRGLRWSYRHARMPLARVARKLRSRATSPRMHPPMGIRPPELIAVPQRMPTETVSAAAPGFPINVRRRTVVRASPVSG
jgi:hypothetical protein